MVADARLKVREDGEKVAHWRTERSKQLDQVRLLDHRVDLWEHAVQDGAAAVVKLVKRQTWQLHEAERAAIVREATRPMSPPRAKSSTARNPSGSTPAASQAGPSRRLPSQPRHPTATSSPVGTRFLGTIPKIRQSSSTRGRLQDKGELRLHRREVCSQEQQQALQLLQEFNSTPAQHGPDPARVRLAQR